MRDRSDSFLSKSTVFDLKDSNNGYAINSKKGNSKPVGRQARLQTKGFLSLTIISNIRPFKE